MLTNDEVNFKEICINILIVSFAEKLKPIACLFKLQCNTPRDNKLKHHMHNSYYIIAIKWKN